jgi:hypothetical protein
MKAKRFARNVNPQPFRLTHRDLSHLQHIARHRFLSSRHLAQLDGGSSQNVLRALRILFDHGFIDRPIAQLATMLADGPRPLVYGLGRRGAQALRTFTGTDWTERNKRSGTKFIEHTLAIADFIVSLELACRGRTDVRMLSEDVILKNAPESTRLAREPLRLVVPGLDNRLGISSVIPDGLFGLHFEDDTASYFLVEIDRGSMPVTRSRFDRTSYLRKLSVYWNAWKQARHREHFGVKQMRVLTLTDSETRIEHMLQAVDQLTEGKGSNFFLFGTFAEVSRSGPLEMSWRSGRRAAVRLSD